jgi:hypothetical protein
MSPELLAALSEGQRSVAHLVVLLGLLAVLAVVGVVYLIRRRARRSDASHERRKTPEDR